MKAIVIPALGGPENLVLEDLPDPEVGPGKLLIDVAAAGVNYVDTYHRKGLYDTTLPFVPGMEGAGVVSEIGEGADDFQIGDRVGWADVRGSYAEKHVIPADRAVPIPDGLESRTVAAVLLQGLTAHYLATDTFPLRVGHRCLIHAGAGGVGLLLTQIAKMRGAEVFTTVGSADKAELSRAAGSDHVIVYQDADFREAVEELAGPKPLDVVYDGVGAETFMNGLDLLRPRGMMVTFGNASGPVPEIAPLLLSQKGSLFLTRPTMAHYLATRGELLSRCEDLFSWIQSDELVVRIGHEYPLADAADAHRALEGRQTTGKV
ncbi:MAG: quinone oxidoreductase family protein, partial [Acidimicrobiia bacterium]